ncbi:hypothetical protein [Actinoplanes sp. NPDC051411]|uniref:nSTAND1 domain-containing NTPase n=1 Tax=Actinoplanes sp. NPDC051411 TaxID=3155522 RepID=UPI00342DA17B
MNTSAVGAGRPERPALVEWVVVDGLSWGTGVNSRRGSEKDAGEAAGESTWDWAGPEARGHFTRRAYGHRAGVQGADLFRGRRTAVDRVVDWLRVPECPGEPLVVVGQPGSGKSAVVGRAVLRAPTAGIERGLAVHARGSAGADLVRAVARLTGHPETIDRFDLVRSLRGVDGGRVWPVVVDALDEAHSSAERSVIAELLVELASVPCMRVVVATRPLAVGSRYAPGTLLRGLMVTDPGSPNLVDLDTPGYFDRQAVVEFAAALLAQEGVPQPGPPGRAWRRFRDDARLTTRLAGLIADRAGHNFLVAALAAYDLSIGRNALDPAEDGFVSASIPAGISEAIDKYLDNLPGPRRVKTRGLLTALAYARGVGVEDPVWLRLAEALGYRAEVADLDELRDSTPADYLLQVSPDDDGEPATRLFHQALADHFLLARASRRTTDERLILRRLMPRDPAEWPRAGRYARAHAAEHAEAAGCLPELLHEPRYLAVADIDRLLPALPIRPVRDLRPTVTVLRRASSRARTLPPHRRARLLALTAAHLGHGELHRKFASSVLWAHRLGDPHQQMAGHEGGVRTVATGSLGGRDVIVSGGFDDGVLLVRDVAGRLVIGPVDTGAPQVWEVAVGHDVIVALDGDGVVRRWDADGRSMGELVGGQAGPVAALAVGSLDGRAVIVTGGDDGFVVWDVEGRRRSGGAGQIEALAVGSWGGRDVIVSGGADGLVHVWDADGRPARNPLDHQDGWVEALAIGRLGDRDVIVSASDRSVRAWDADGQPVFAPLSLPHWAVRDVAVGRLEDRDVIVSGGGDGVIRVWDADGKLVSELRDGRSPTVETVTIACLDGRDVIVSCGEEEALRVWDVDIHSGGSPIAGHSGQIGAVAVGRLGDGNVVVSADYDGTIRRWDTDGNPIGGPIDSGTSLVVALAIGWLRDRRVIVSGSVAANLGDRKEVLMVWDAGAQLLGEPIEGHHGIVNDVAIGRVGDGDVIVSVGGHEIRIHDADGHLIGEPIEADGGAVEVGRFGDEDVIVVGGGDGLILVRDGGRPERIWAEPVLAVALGRVDGRDVIVAGEEDGRVLMWEEGRLSGAKSICSHTGQVSAVAVGGDMILSAGDDGKVRCSTSDGTEVDTIDLLEAVNALSFVASSRTLYVATGTALSRWQL